MTRGMTTDTRAPRTEKRCRICRQAHWRAPTGWIADHTSEPVDFPIEAEAAADPVAGEDIEAIRKALKIGAISYDGDSWYAASSEGGAGLGYDECEAAMKEGFAALNRIAAALPTPAPEEGEGK